MDRCEAEIHDHAEIVAFTPHVARSLIAKARMTAALDWDFGHSYPRIAARMTRMLLWEYASHLRESRRGIAPGSSMH